MATDPKQLFVTNAITRQGIADELGLEANDDRLTDEVCQRFADELGQLDDDDTTELCEKFAAELGL